MKPLFFPSSHFQRSTISIHCKMVPLTSLFLVLVSFSYLSQNELFSNIWYSYSFAFPEFKMHGEHALQPSFICCVPVPFHASQISTIIWSYHVFFQYIVFTLPEKENMYPYQSYLVVLWPLYPLLSSVHPSDFNWSGLSPDRLFPLILTLFTAYQGSANVMITSLILFVWHLSIKTIMENEMTV